MCKPKLAKHTQLYNPAGSGQHRVGQHASRACCLETLVFANLERGGRCAKRRRPGTSSFIAGSVLDNIGFCSMPPGHVVLETMMYGTMGRVGRFANQRWPGTSSLIAGSVPNKNGLDTMPPRHAAWETCWWTIWAGRVEVQTKDRLAIYRFRIVPCMDPSDGYCPEGLGKVLPDRPGQSANQKATWKGNPLLLFAHASSGLVMPRGLGQSASGPAGSKCKPKAAWKYNGAQ
jgi:hypothetical protein